MRDIPVRSIPLVLRLVAAGAQANSRRIALQKKLDIAARKAMSRAECPANPKSRGCAVPGSTPGWKTPLLSSLANQQSTLPGEVPFPFVPSRVEQPRDASRQWVDPGDVWPLVRIVMQARQSQIVEGRGATVLPSDRAGHAQHLWRGVMRTRRPCQSHGHPKILSLHSSVS
jgi:hypothetical protein